MRRISAAVTAILASSLTIGLARPVFGAPMARIVGGDDALSEQYPWQVALLNDQDEDYLQRRICGGSIVADRWVLTAAHCVTADLTSVLVGRGDLGEKTGATELSIVGRYTHPDYNARTGHQDIALLQLSEPLDFSASGVAPIDLLDTELSPGLTEPGMPAVITGWGRRNHVWPLDPDQLQAATVQFFDRFDYEHVQWVLEGYIITDAMLIAGMPGGGVGSCHGDSGGPLVVYDPIAPSAYRLAGVTSWGLGGCAEPGYPGIYTRVSSSAEWVKSYIEGPAAAVHDRVQLAYLAYYGRPADPEGLAYWGAQIAAAGANWTPALLEQFTRSEALESLGLDQPVGLIEAVYRNLFAREAEPQGLAYYSDLLEGANTSGLNPDWRWTPPAAIVPAIADGASSEDSVVLQHKLRVCEYATQELSERSRTFTDASHWTYVDLLAAVDASPESVQEAWAQIDATFPTLTRRRPHDPVGH